MTLTYVVAIPRRILLLEILISESKKPIGMAMGNAKATTASAIRKPLNTIGKLVTRIGGLRKSLRNLFEFHF